MGRGLLARRFALHREALGGRVSPRGERKGFLGRRGYSRSGAGGRVQGGACRPAGLCATIDGAVGGWARPQQAAACLLLHGSGWGRSCSPGRKQARADNHCRQLMRRPSPRVSTTYIEGNLCPPRLWLCPPCAGRRGLEVGTGCARDQGWCWSRPGLWGGIAANGSVARRRWLGSRKCERPRGSEWQRNTREGLKRDLGHGVPAGPWIVPTCSHSGCPSSGAASTARHCYTRDELPQTG